MKGDPINERYMRQALTLAAGALESGEFPIAALVVLGDRVLASATASEQSQRRYLGHAELAALEAADKLHLSYAERRQAVLYTNLEPCLMCMGAAMSFFLGEIVYGLESPGDGAVELVRGWVRKEADIPGYQVPRIQAGVLREESLRLFKKYVNRQPPGPMRDWAQTLANLK